MDEKSAEAAAENYRNWWSRLYERHERAVAAERAIKDLMDRTADVFIEAEVPRPTDIHRSSWQWFGITGSGDEGRAHLLTLSFDFFEKAAVCLYYPDRDETTYLPNLDPKAAQVEVSRILKTWDQISPKEKK